jgi:cell division protein FtsZ
MLQTTVDMHSHQHNEIEFWAVNTDYQALGRAQAAGANVLTIGGTGLGAGGVPDNGRTAAEAAASEIRERICRPDVDLVFITAGMGGGTGSGAAPVIARLAVAADCLTVAVVTTPFLFEGMHRRRQADRALATLQAAADTVIAVSNDKLLQMIPPETPLEQAFLVADDILRQGVVGIADVIVRPGLINVDFADVEAILKKPKVVAKQPTSLDEYHDESKPRPELFKNALMGIGVGTGPHAALEAAEAAITSPLLERQILAIATSVVFCISGGKSLTLNQVNAASQRIYQSVSPSANVIFGAVVDETMGDDISITVLATGGVAPPVLDKPTPMQRPRAVTSTTTTTSVPKVPSFLKSRKPSP